MSGARSPGLSRRIRRKPRILVDYRATNAGIDTLGPAVCEVGLEHRIEWRMGDLVAGFSSQCGGESTRPAIEHTGGRGAYTQAMYFDWIRAAGFEDPMKSDYGAFADACAIDAMKPS